jgi:hypothetical protein
VWSAGSERWDLYLGRSDSAVALRGAQTQPDWQAHADPETALVARMKQVAQHHKGWRRPVVSVWLSGDLARPFVLQPVAGLATGAEALALAASAAPAATGVSAPCAVWLSAAPQQQTTIAVAMPAALRDLILLQGKAARVRIAGVRPWWALAQKQLLAGQPTLELLALEDTDAVVLLAGNASGWLAAEAYAPKPQQAAERQALLTRRAFAAGVESAAMRAASLPDPLSAPGTGWLRAMDVQGPNP